VGHNDITTLVVKSILRLTFAGVVVGTVLVAPNAAIALEKPLRKYLDKLDDEAKQRELKRVVRYMRSQGLVNGSYEHGLQITERGRARLSKMELDAISIDEPKQWDKKWRMVFYDIPEESKVGRNSLTRKLHSIGFHQLQRSVFIHPFDSREVIEKIASTYYLDKYVSYVEATYIDNQQILIAHFKKRFPAVSFK
jgi:DNA-binding transcriptional regulator PaaX